MSNFLYYAIVVIVFLVCLYHLAQGIDEKFPPHDEN